MTTMELQEKLQKPGWDNERAIPKSSVPLMKVLSLLAIAADNYSSLKEPEIIPCTDKSVLISWTLDDIELMLEVSDNSEDVTWEIKDKEESFGHGVTKDPIKVLDELIKAK